MDFRILGPLEVREGEREVPLGRGKQRALLALLLLHRDQAISTDRIADELWGERPPPTAAKIVQNHVLQLRRALEDGGSAGADLVTRGRGYMLRVERGSSTWTRSSSSWRRASARSAPGRRPRRPRRFVRPSRSGAGHRSPTSPTSRSRRRRSRASRSCAWPRSSAGSRRISPSAGMRTSSAS